MGVNPQEKMKMGLMTDQEITIQKIGMIQLQAPGSTPSRLILQMATVVLILQRLVCLDLVQKGTRQAMNLWPPMVKIWLWALQTMDSLSESGKDVVLQRNMDMHGDTGHHLQSALLFGPAMMEEEMTDGTVSIGMEEMVLTVDVRQ